MDPSKSNYTLVSAVTAAAITVGGIFWYVKVAQDKLPLIPAVPSPAPTIIVEASPTPSPSFSVSPLPSVSPTPTSSGVVSVNVNVTLPLPSGVPTPVISLGPVRLGL